MGTAAAAVPVRSIARLSTHEKYSFSKSESGDGKLVELSKLMASIQRGNSEDTEDWCWEVTGYPEQADASPAAGAATTQWSLLLSTVSSLKTISNGLWNAVPFSRG